jgi:integrase
MEQRITLYRYHSPNCIHGYTDALYEGESKLPDCRCPIYGRGNLRNESKRINNKTLAEKGKSPVTDWDVAKAIRERWLKQGHTGAASSTLEPLTDPTIEQGIEFFKESKTAADVAGKSTMKKYETLFKKRLIPWCAANRIEYVKQLDDSTKVTAFFNSWKNLRYALKPIGKNTKRAERERLSSFLNFWKDKLVLKVNHANPKSIRLGKSKIEPKYGFTENELTRVMDAFELWEDEYGRMDTPKARMVAAFAYTLRDIGQRISDVAMLGPSNIEQDGENFYVVLTQIKTGTLVKVPVERETVDRLRALPFRGVLDASFVLETKHATITYPAGGYWFWTGESDLTGNSNAWSMDIGRVLQKAAHDYHTEAESNPSVRALGLFKTHHTAHSFRHYFAISMLSVGVDVETVSRWLGHADVKITLKHYGHANKDYHDAASKKMMEARKAIAARRDESKKSKKTAKVLPMRKAG